MRFKQKITIKFNLSSKLVGIINESKLDFIEENLPKKNSVEMFESWKLNGDTVTLIDTVDF